MRQSLLSIEAHLIISRLLIFAEDHTNGYDHWIDTHEFRQFKVNICILHLVVP